MRKTLLLSGIAALLSVSSCGLMHDDLQPCAVPPNTYTSVDFLYNYNTENRDLFPEHIGSVSVYVFDSNGNFVIREERSNLHDGNSLTKPGFQIDFSNDVLKPGNSYKVYAIGHGNPGGYEASTSTPGFTNAEDYNNIKSESDFALLLDHENGYVVNDGVLIDSLWTTRQPVILDIPEVVIPKEGDPQEPDRYIKGTVELMRVTNKLEVCFWQEDFPTDINPKNYEIIIESKNGSNHLDFFGNPITTTELTYTPYNVRTENRSNNSGAKACVIAEFGLSRLWLTNDINLTIRDLSTGAETTLSDLPKYLARGNEAFGQYGWSDQEYLDREYDFSIELPFTGEVAKWIQVNVEILGWSKRYQVVNF